MLLLSLLSLLPNPRLRLVTAEALLCGIRLWSRVNMVGLRAVRLLKGPQNSLPVFGV